MYSGFADGLISACYTLCELRCSRAPQSITCRFATAILSLTISTNSGSKSTPLHCRPHHNWKDFILGQAIDLDHAAVVTLSA